MSNTDRDALLERWADGMEKLEQYYENLYGPPGTPATLPDVTNHDGMLEAIADRMERMQKNINKKSATYHNTDTSFVKTVPAYVHQASIEQIGGKTFLWNQLVDTGTTTVSTISGHKYYALIDGTASIITSDGTAISVVDDTADMVCDLTLMLGSGKEFATTDDFTEVFPSTHYAYNAGSLLFAGVTSVVSKGTNNTIIATYSIPASVQALDSYGNSTRTKANTVDYEAKTYTQNVKRVNLGDLNWIMNANFGGYPAFYSQDVVCSEVNDHSVADMLCSSYDVVSRYTLYNSSNPAICLTGSGHIRYITVRDTTYASADAFKAGVNGVEACVVLKTPVETDISAYLTDDNLIEVEAGGTLTIENQNGDDYRIPVPSAETFWVDVS